MSFPILAPFGFFMFIVLIMNIQLGLLSVYSCFSSFIAAAIHFLLNSGVIPAEDHRKFVLCLVKDNYLTEKILKAALYLCEIFRCITMETLLHHNRSRSPGLQQCCIVCVCVFLCCLCKGDSLVWTFVSLQWCNQSDSFKKKKTADNQVLLHYYLGTLIRSRFWDLFSSDLLYSFCNALSHAYQLAT